MNEIVVRSSIIAVQKCKVCHGKAFENTAHHRHPTSIGGSNHKVNISRIPDYLHKWWHVVVYNLHAVLIANLITSKGLIAGTAVAVPKYMGLRGVVLTRSVARHHNLLQPLIDVEHSYNMREAWKFLTQGLDSDIERLEYVNEHFLDPYYRLMLVVDD